MKIGINELYSELVHQQSFIFTLQDMKEMNDTDARNYLDVLNALKEINIQIAKKYGDYIETSREGTKFNVKSITSKEFYNF